MIIVEGPNGAGKTALVRLLSKDLELQVGERSADRNELYQVARQDTYNAIGEAVKGFDPVRIWDRLFFSELVYAPVMGRKGRFRKRQFTNTGRECQFTNTEERYVYRILDALRCPIIFCIPPEETVLKNVEDVKDPERADVRENTQEIFRSYIGIRNGCHSSRHFDYTQSSGFGPSYEDILRHCKRYISQRVERSWSW